MAVLSMKEINMESKEKTNLSAALPEEIISRIFSLLPIRDAIRTSVLARRWRYEWTHFTTNFDFDARVLFNLGSEKQLRKTKINKYCGYTYWLMVDNVMKSIRSPTINELRINYGHQWSCKENLDRWIKISLAKRVQTLELDLTHVYGYGQFGDQHYIFPQRVCEKDSSFSRLKNLSLTYVDIPGKTVEYILCKYPLLEKLSINHSKVRDDIRVCGPSLKLKHLEIQHCYYKSVQVVDALNLISFTYEGKLLYNPLKNVPRLTQLSINAYGFDTCGFVPNIPLQLPQLETLKICLGLQEISEEFSAQFKNIKHLDLEWVLLDNSFTSLLAACPSLCKLTINGWKICEKQSMVANKEDQYQSLREVEITIRRDDRFENASRFVSHIVENAKMLKKLIIRLDLKLSATSDEASRDFVELAYKQWYMQLAAKLPPTVQFAVVSC